MRDYDERIGHRNLRFLMWKIGKNIRIQKKK